MTRDDVIRTLRACANLLVGGDLRKLRPGGPTVTIGGRAYVLSSDGGPLGDREDDDALADTPGLIIQRGGDKHRYLWVFDLEGDRVAMWRASDGNEKASGSAAHYASTIRKLDQRGQLNRVTEDEFDAVERHMRDLEQQRFEELERLVEENKDEVQRAIDKAAVKFFDEKVRSKVEHAVAAVDDGVIPIGYKPIPGRSEVEEHRSKVNWAMEAILRREFTLDKFEAYCRHHGIDLDKVDIQATDWAMKDVYLKVAQEFLPKR